MFMATRVPPAAIRAACAMTHRSISRMSAVLLGHGEEAPGRETSPLRPTIRISSSWCEIVPAPSAMMGWP